MVIVKLKIYRKKIFKSYRNLFLCEVDAGMYSVLKNEQNPWSKAR